MRTVVLALLLVGATADAGVLGLELGMTPAQVRAAKPCRAPSANAAKAQLTCKGVAFAGSKIDVELSLPKAGLARIAMSARLPAARKDAEAAADAILDKLGAEFGTLEMTGAGALGTSAALFDNADRQYAQFRGKLVGGSLFTAPHVPSNEPVHLGGKLVRDKKGYALEVTLTR